MSFFDNALLEVRRSGVTAWNRNGVAYPLLIALEWTCDIIAPNQHILSSNLQDINTHSEFYSFKVPLPKGKDPAYHGARESSGNLLKIVSGIGRKRP